MTDNNPEKTEDVNTPTMDDATQSAVSEPLVSDTDMVKISIQEAVDFAEERLSKMKQALSEQRTKTEEDVKGIKKQAERKLAADFITAMKTLDDEVQQAAAVKDTASLSLKSMTEGLAMINNVAKGAVEGLDVDVSANSQSATTPENKTVGRRRRIGGILNAAKATFNPFDGLELVQTRINDALAKAETLDGEEKDTVIASLNELNEGITKAADQYAKNNDRASKDKDNAAKFGAEKLTQKFVEVVDNMDRAITAAESHQDDLAADAELKRLYDGVKETKGYLLEAFAKHGIEREDPKGQALDPHSHMAVSSRPAQDGEAKNTIAEVMAPGYRLNGRVVRAAMVIVAN